MASNLDPKLKKIENVDYYYSRISKESHPQIKPNKRPFIKINKLIIYIYIYIYIDILKITRKERKKERRGEMAELFKKQGKEYAETRPSYPPELFRFIESRTPEHHLAWDVGTGNGQAALSLAEIFDKVIATDTSEEQLSLAQKHAKIYYQHTPSTMSIPELEHLVAPPATVDVVTVAQALHWFANPEFFSLVKHVLKPNGVFAAWCYTLPSVDAEVDQVMKRLYKKSSPFWSPERKLVDEEYRSIEFPFEPVAGEESTGPFKFKTVKMMELGEYMTYIRSWSSYQTAKGKGVELLTEEVVDELVKAWGGHGEEGVKMVNYPILLRIGKI
ncbi:putative trans-aconitate 3-methyltransferase [Dioscorea sansibarensis]